MSSETPRTPSARRLAARSWIVACAVFCLGSIATRALHFAFVDLPPDLDDALGAVMSFHFRLAFNQAGLLLCLGALLLPVIWLALRRRLRVLTRPETSAAGLSLDPWVAGWLWLAFAAFNPLFDLNPGLAGLQALSLPLLLCGPWLDARLGNPRVSGPVLLLAWAALLGGWIFTHEGWFHVAYPALWITACVLLTASRRRFLHAADWLASGLVFAVFLQLATLLYGLAPGSPADAGARRIADGTIYDWCEIPARGRIYGTHTACGRNRLEECTDDYVVEYEAGTLAEVGRHHFFDERFRGRMLHLLCLEDRVQVGMATTEVDGRIFGSNVLEFDAEDPSRVTRDLLGKGDGRALGQVFVRDRAGRRIFYVSEFSSEVLRVADDGHGSQRRIEIEEAAFAGPRTLGPFRWSFPGSLATAPGAVYPPRGSGFFSQWIFGSRVIELDFETARVSRVYRTNNGGNNVPAVDAELARLLVPGLWGVEVVDLETGRTLHRLRTEFGPRRPVIDAVRDRVYVTTTLGNDILVFDRRDLRRLGGLRVGLGGRNAYLTADGRHLLSSGAGQTWAWSAAELARRFGSR